MWQKKINAKSELRFWLSNRKSLSKRVKNIAQFQVIQIRPSNIKFLKIEGEKFRNIRDGQLYLREVMIYADDRLVMYARTVTPKINLRGFWRGIRKLQDNPLSDIIFEKKIGRIRDIKLDETGKVLLLTDQGFLWSLSKKK